jgi:hypothetical protein
MEAKAAFNPAADMATCREPLVGSIDRIKARYGAASWSKQAKLRCSHCRGNVTGQAFTRGQPEGSTHSFKDVDPAEHEFSFYR